MIPADFGFSFAYLYGPWCLFGIPLCAVAAVVFYRRAKTGTQR